MHRRSLIDAVITSVTATTTPYHTNVFLSVNEQLELQKHMPIMHDEIGVYKSSNIPNVIALTKPSLIFVDLLRHNAGDYETFGP